MTVNAQNFENSRLRHRRAWLLAAVVASPLLGAGTTRPPAGRFHPPGDPPTLVRRPSPLAMGDADHDGLPDAWELALAERYAPIVLLDGADAYHPASIRWLLARLPAAGRSVSERLAASLGHEGDAFPPQVRAGSTDPRDWVAYVHVFPRTDGGISIQYWFFYPYNFGLVLFDHEGDWEHVTVQLDERQEPRALSLAQHGNTRPGVSRAWGEVSKVGQHPVIWSARGTHASYPDRSSSPWYERVSSCVTPADCPDPVWRTWEGGGIVNIGERNALLEDEGPFAFAGRWGGAGNWLHRLPPYGPNHQRRSFQHGGFE